MSCIEPHDPSHGRVQRARLNPKFQICCHAMHMHAICLSNNKSYVIQDMMGTTSPKHSPRQVQDSYAAGPSQERRVSYGSTTSSSGSPDMICNKGKEPALEDHAGLVEFEEWSEYEENPVIDCTAGSL